MQSNKEFLQNVADLLNDPYYKAEAERELREYCGLSNWHRCLICNHTNKSWNNVTGLGCGCDPTMNTTIVMVDEESRALSKEPRLFSFDPDTTSNGEESITVMAYTTEGALALIKKEISNLDEISLEIHNIDWFVNKKFSVRSVEKNTVLL